MGFLQWTNSWMLVFPLIVLLYYFFRKKYTKQEISSVLFWEEVMQETKASPYLKKLQKNVLLFLQLAALLLLILALMGPYMKSTTIKGEQVIFIVDTSATMLAGKNETLFTQHKEKILSLVKQADGSEMTIVTTGAMPNVVVRQETDAKIVEQIVAQLEVTYEEEHMANVLQVVQSLIGQTPTSVYVFTDQLEKTALPLETNYVEWQVFGQTEKLENFAISKFAAMDAERGITALIQIENATDKDQIVPIEIADERGLTFRDEVNVEAKSIVNHVMNNLQLGNQLTASITVQDDYEVDNYWSTTIQHDQMTVVLDQNTHALVQKGFAAVYDDVTFFQRIEDVEKSSFVVTNEVELLNSGNPVLLIGRNDVESKVVEHFANSSSHILFNFSPLENVYVQSLYPAFDEYDTIATVNEQPFIQLTERGDIIVLADMEATDWPLHPSFPLFLWSAIQQLSVQQESLGSFAPMQSASLVIPEKQWSIYNTEGQFISSFTGGKQFIAPTEPGFYELNADHEVRTIAVVLNEQERKLAEGENYKLGQIEVAEKEELTKSSFVPWLIFIILLLFILEWEVQRRRGFTN